MVIEEGLSTLLGSWLVWCDTLTLYSSPSPRQGLCGMRTDRLGRAARREEPTRIKTDNWFIIPLTSPSMAQIRSLQRSVRGLGYPQRTFFSNCCWYPVASGYGLGKLIYPPLVDNQACILCVLQCSRTLGCLILFRALVFFCPLPCMLLTRLFVLFFSISCDARVLCVLRIACTLWLSLSLLRRQGRRICHRQFFPLSFFLSS